MDQTDADLQDHLQDCLEFLRKSCQAFDDGHSGEAKRLATTIRVLVHDTANSKSLLGQLGQKGKLRFVNTALPHDPVNLLAHHGLVILTLSQEGGSYRAPLGEVRPTHPATDSRFDTWWNQVVIADKNAEKFTRRDLVLALANQDGGAHVDPNLNAAYANLSRKNSVGWYEVGDDPAVAVTGVERHSVRQIAYEVLQTLDPRGRDAA